VGDEIIPKNKRHDLTDLPPSIMKTLLGVRNHMDWQDYNEIINFLRNQQNIAVHSAKMVKHIETQLEEARQKIVELERKGD
jgi:5-bromo-4-chloroindolyl phosphate hydrolysis protein